MPPLTNSSIDAALSNTSSTIASVAESLWLNTSLTTNRHHHHQQQGQTQVHFVALPPGVVQSQDDQQPQGGGVQGLFEDFDLPVQETILAPPAVPAAPRPARPTPRPRPGPKGKKAGVNTPLPTPTPTGAATDTDAHLPIGEHPSATPSPDLSGSYGMPLAPPLPRATPAPSQLLAKRWDETPAPAPMPTPTSTHHPCTHSDNCPCPGPTCMTATDIVWLHNVTTVAPATTPTYTSICETVEQTSVYWETQKGIWLTTVFPVASTYWVWEKVPHTVHSYSTSFSETFVSAGGCPLPPHDWCQDGWIDGVWHGEGEAPCWFPPDHWHHHHWHWPHASDVFGHLYSDQIATLIAIPIMLVIILILWSVTILALIFLLPFQLFTNFVHEISHVVVGIIGGAKICSMTIDPGCGPISTMRNGTPAMTLLAGYIGSMLFGWGIVTCAFDEKASKITYIVTSPIWFPVIWFTVGFLPKLQIAIVLGLSVALWFIWEARLLRFYMLFIGLMSLFYVVWDCIDDFIFHKQNESDASLLNRLYPGVAPGSEYNSI
ncbi:unnamed protein product [Sympodiomycopsis kandeliae]